MQTEHGDFADSYQRDGYYFPIRVISEQTAAEYRQAFEAIEKEHATDEESQHLLYKFSTFRGSFFK